MRVKNWTLPYMITFILVWFSKQGYYRRVTRRGLANIPKNKPVIFAANHQNSLIDPIVIATTNRFPVFFLTKSDVFKKPFIAKILYSLNMLPIYRERDGADFKEKNVAIFNRCSQILAGNGRIIIFPEGSHNNQNRLRNLKKGIARIALQANRETEEDIWIVPVGLNYTNTRNKCADLLVSYGKAINATELINSKKDVVNENEVFHPLMSQLAEGMREEMLDYQIEKFYGLYDFFISSIKRTRTTVKSKFIWDKQKSEKLTDFITANTSKASEMKAEVESVEEVCEKENLRAYLFNKTKHSLFLPLLGLIVGFPIFVLGIITSYIPSIIPQQFLLNKIKDRQYDSSINMVLGGFLLFLFWVIQTIIIAWITEGYWWMLYFVFCVIAAWFAFEYYVFYLRFIGKKNYNKYVKDNPDAAKKIQNSYSSLKQFIFNL